MLKSFSYDTANFKPTQFNCITRTVKTVSGIATCYNYRTDELEKREFSGVKGTVENVKIKEIEKKIMSACGYRLQVMKVRDLKENSKKIAVPLEALEALGLEIENDID